MGFSGGIPSTLANLTDLDSLALYDDNFSTANVSERLPSGDFLDVDEEDDWVENEVQNFLATLN